MYLFTTFSLSPQCAIVAKCLRNTWHGSHRLSNLGIKILQFIASIVSSSSAVLFFFVFKFSFDTFPFIMNCSSQSHEQTDNLLPLENQFYWQIWGEVFKNGPSKICERQPLKTLK